MPMAAPKSEIIQPSTTKMCVTCWSLAPRLRRVAMLSSFSMMSSESVLMTLNVAIIRMKPKSKNAIHFSIFTRR